MKRERPEVTLTRNRKPRVSIMESVIALRASLTLAESGSRPENCRGRLHDHETSLPPFHVFVGTETFLTAHC